MLNTVASTRKKSSFSLKSAQEIALTTAVGNTVHYRTGTGFSYVAKEPYLKSTVKMEIWDM